MGGGDSYHPHGHHTFKGVLLPQGRTGPHGLPTAAADLMGCIWCAVACRGLESIWWLVVRPQGMEA